MHVAYWGQVSWCPRGTSPGGRPHGTERRVREKGLRPFWSQKLLSLRTRGSSTHAPGELPGSLTPSEQGPLPKPVTANVQVRGGGSVTAEMTHTEHLLCGAVRGSADKDPHPPPAPRILLTPKAAGRPQGDSAGHQPRRHATSSAELTSGPQQDLMGPSDPRADAPSRLMKSHLTVWRSLPGCKASVQPASCGAMLKRLRGAGGEEKLMVTAQSHWSGEAGRPQGGSGNGLTGPEPVSVGPSGSEPHLCHTYLAANLDFGVSHPFG